MEEDIKILEDMFYDDESFEPNGYVEIFLHKNEQQAIKNLIARYKEYEKQLDLDYVDNNYIPKSKVKEKIEELDTRIGECCENIDKTVNEERAYWEKEKRDAIMQRFILQELLED